MSLAEIHERRCAIPRAGKLLVGTSGYSYKQWKGNFYPEKLPDREMLPFYAKQFSTVEINHSFYRMPTETSLLNWAKSVPEGFRFALKANQQITHIHRLRGCESTLKRFLEVASILNDGDHLGPILVQLPPTFKFDRPLLENFLAFRRVAGPRRRRLRLLQTRGRGQGPRLRSPASRTIAILFRFRARACDGIFAFGVFMKHSRARYIVPLRQPASESGRPLAADSF